MGDIIAFPSNARRERAAGARPASGAGEILFFLGVRYAPMTEPPFAANGAPNERGNDSNRTRKRKRRA